MILNYIWKKQNKKPNKFYEQKLTEYPFCKSAECISSWNIKVQLTGVALLPIDKITVNIYSNWNCTTWHMTCFILICPRIFKFVSISLLCNFLALLHTILGNVLPLISQFKLHVYFISDLFETSFVSPHQSQILINQSWTKKKKRRRKKLQYPVLQFFYFFFVSWCNKVHMNKNCIFSTVKITPNIYSNNITNITSYTYDNTLFWFTKECLHLRPFSNTITAQFPGISFSNQFLETWFSLIPHSSNHKVTL